MIATLVPRYCDVEAIGRHFEFRHGSSFIGSPPQAQRKNRPAQNFPAAAGERTRKWNRPIPRMSSRKNEKRIDGLSLAKNVAVQHRENPLSTGYWSLCSGDNAAFMRSVTRMARPRGSKSNPTRTKPTFKQSHLHKVVRAARTMALPIAALTVDPATGLITVKIGEPTTAERNDLDVWLNKKGEKECASG